MNLREKKFRAEARILEEMGLVRHKINGIHNFYKNNESVSIGDVSKCVELIKGRLANCINNEGKPMSEAEIVDFINKESFYKNSFAVLSSRIQILDKCGITEAVILHKGSLLDPAYDFSKLYNFIKSRNYNVTFEDVKEFNESLVKTKALVMTMGR